MTWLLLGAGFVVLAWAIIAAALNANSSTMVRIVKLTIGFVAMAAVIGLLISGRISLALWLIPILLILAVRWRGLVMALQTAFSGQAFLHGGPASGTTSEVESPYLRMVLDHDSGDMAGEILQGQFAGRTIDDLDLGDLMSLLAELQQHDTDGARLLTAWLDRSVHADSWRETAQGDGGPRAGSSSGMTREEAAEILGVEIDADEPTIREAHHRLMAANHPDKGGSPWVARQINMARDTLLNE